MNTTTKLNFTNNKTGYLNKEEYADLLKTYYAGNLQPTPKEGMVVNPKLAYYVSNEMIAESIPDNLAEYKDIYGKINRFSRSSPVDNLLWDYLYFVDSNLFRPAALRYEKSVKKIGKRKASYCPYPKGTKAHNKYWSEEFRRCTEGFEPSIDDVPSGIRISGEYYFYLNYGRINKLIEQNDGQILSVEGFPDFLAMDYYYFRELEARSTPSIFGLPNEYRKSIILAKSRRKGFSFKAAASAVWIMTFNNAAKVAIASAPDTKQTDAALAAGKAVPTIDHLSNNTPFGRKAVGDVKLNGGWKNEISSVTKLKVNITLGIFNTRTKEKRGRQSSLITLSLSKDDAASGEGLTRLYFEEAGKTSNLNKAWVFAKETMKAGSLYKGLAIIFGCFAEGTMVYNNKGIPVDIKDLDKEEGIIGYSGISCLPQKIEQVKIPIQKQCVELSTQYGSVTCSADHPMLVTYADSSKNKYNVDYTGFDETCSTRNYRTLSCWYERADAITKNHALVMPNLTNKQDIPFGNSKLDSNIKHSNNGLLQYILNNIKTTGVIPDKVWDLDKESTWKFISALFDLKGTGSIYREDPINKGTMVMYSLDINSILGGYNNSFDKSVVDKFSRSLKMLFLKLGIVAFTKGDDMLLSRILKGSFKQHYDKLNVHDLYISNPKEVVSLFIKNTSFQNRDLRAVSKHYNEHMIPESLSRNPNAVVNKALVDRYKFPNIMKFDDESSIKTNDMTFTHIKNTYVFKVIKAPKKIKEPLTVYNLNCTPSHNYIANGYIAGNTGGEMISSTGNKGRSMAFASLFNSPEANDLAAFENIYDYQPRNEKCGYFVSDMWANFGATVTMNGTVYNSMDKQGNAFFWVAELSLNKDRFALMPPKGKQSDYNLFLTQRCKTPSEAFFKTEGEIFNTADLIIVQNNIDSSTYGFSKYFTAGELVEDVNGGVEFYPDIEGKLQPILSETHDNNNKEGCLIMYERPKKINGVIPPDAYIITCDPIGQNTESGNSKISILVMKTPVYQSHAGFGYTGIVASYVGRKKYSPMTYGRELLLKLSKFYNAKITYENDRDGGILLDFTNKKELARLLGAPTLVTNKHLKSESSTNLRVFGHSMATKHHKALGEVVLNEWLDYRHPDIKGVDDAGNYVVKKGPRNMDLLKDQLIIEQLISYTREGNYDGVMSLMGGVIQMVQLYDSNLQEVQRKAKQVNDDVDDWIRDQLNMERIR
jgi:hypothetical protein